MSNLMRLEHDSIGKVEVPKEALWGAQTQRAIKNFDLNGDLMPIQLVHALAKIKHAAAICNYKLGLISQEKSIFIIEAALIIEKGLCNDQFPLTVWQTGSGTNTNMNVNEVISNIASKKNGEPLGTYKTLHPNDDVNKSQSTNDCFPAAIQMAIIEGVKKKLIPELELIEDIFELKSKEWNKIIKIGRTHLQDAVPLTLGQEVSAWKDQIKFARKKIEESILELYELPLGGTAVGTGLNTPKGFDKEIAKELKILTGFPFKASGNKFAIMASHNGIVNAMAQLRMLAITLLKIVNDIRLLSCGPRGGIYELILPANEPGSSIMPGKVNPTQCESMAMICTQIIGLNSAVGIAGGGGHLQMNSYKPLIGFNALHSIELLTSSCRNCRVNMFIGMQPNQIKIKKNLEHSLMLVTALVPEIGYEKAAEIAKYAHKENTTLREAALKLGYINEIGFDRIINPTLMTYPHD